MVRQFVFSKTNLLVGLFSLLIMMCAGALFAFAPAHAESSDLDISVSINSAIAISLTNCDSTDSSQLSIQLTPTPTGTFKSNCQTVSVNTNAPGYTLTAKASSTTLNYLNPTTITPTPTIPSITSTTTTPSTLTNNTWGFAVEALNSTDTPSNQASTTFNFDSSYTIDNESNTYAGLPTTDTTIYQTDQFPLPQTNHTFYYATKATTDNVAGTYSTTITYTAIGAEVPEPLVFKQISTGSAHTCAIASDSNAYCWGSGANGVLGNGDNASSNTPASVSKLTGGLGGLTVKQISAGSSHTCVIASDDNAYCWGTGANGRLGNGETSFSNVPVPVSKLTGGLGGLTVKQISAGSSHTCVIASDDNAYCWGYNDAYSGVLGDGSTNQSSIPVAVSKLSGGLAGLTIKQISAGNNTTCVIASNNDAYCWGRGANGILGNGGTVESFIPVAVSKLSGGLAGLTIKQISVSSNSTCAIASDSNAYCWGYNGAFGLLGNGSTARSAVPIPVSKLAGGLDGLTIKQISVGEQHACATASDDNAYCWGQGTNGRLGNGETTASTIPVPVSRLANGLDGLAIQQVSAGGSYTCTITSNDNAYCWGSNASGQLGNGLSGSANDSGIPVKVIIPTP